MADADPQTLRISIDTKATVNVGEYSRGGRSRGPKAVAAADHDMCTKRKMIPGGILETGTGSSYLFFAQSYKTSDMIADGIESWWEERKSEYPEITRLVLNMDNGPECSGHRTQFLQRMVEFVDTTGLEVHLAYYPPYHSKYNPIERYWAGLERSWNGYLLDTTETVLRRAGNFVWKGIRPIVKLIDTVYVKGVKVKGRGKRILEQRIDRSQRLPWWDIKIAPIMVS